MNAVLFDRFSRDFERQLKVNSMQHWVEDTKRMDADVPVQRVMYSVKKILIVPPLINL